MMPSPLSDFPLNCPTMFPSFHLSAQVCAEVQASAQRRLDEGEVDRFVHSRYGSGGAYPAEMNKRAITMLETGERTPLYGHRSHTGWAWGP